MQDTSTQSSDDMKMTKKDWIYMILGALFVSTLEILTYGWPF
jgi:hypothetical protein